MTLLKSIEELEKNKFDSVNSDIVVKTKVLNLSDITLNPPVETDYNSITTPFIQVASLNVLTVNELMIIKSSDTVYLEEINFVCINAVAILHVYKVTDVSDISSYVPAGQGIEYSIAPNYTGTEELLAVYKVKKSNYLNYSLALGERLVIKATFMDTFGEEQLGFSVNFKKAI